MKDELSIGSVPLDEPCEQVGSSTYDRDKAIKECRVFIKQLRRQFGEEPEGARLFVKSNPHDFGTYHEVNVEFDSDNEAAINYAFGIEAGTPENWDAEAKRELEWSPVQGNVMTEAHIMDKARRLD